MYKSFKRYATRTNNICRRILKFKSPNEVLKRVSVQGCIKKVVGLKLFSKSVSQMFDYYRFLDCPICYCNLVKIKIRFKMMCLLI